CRLDYPDARSDRIQPAPPHGDAKLPAKCHWRAPLAARLMARRSDLNPQPASFPGEMTRARSEWPMNGRSRQAVRAPHECAGILPTYVLKHLSALLWLLPGVRFGQASSFAAQRASLQHAAAFSLPHQRLSKENRSPKRRYPTKDA